MKMKRINGIIISSVIAGMFLWEAILDLTIWCRTMVDRCVGGSIALFISIIIILIARYHFGRDE